MKTQYHIKITFEAPYHFHPAPFYLEFDFTIEETTYGEVKKKAYELASTMDIPEGYVKIENFEITKEIRL